MKQSIRNIYSNYKSVDDYYRETERYENPHSVVIDKLIKTTLDINPHEKVLDLCSGNGLVSKILMSVGSTNIHGNDPYLYKHYKSITGKKCYKQSFKDIAQNGLDEKYDMIICAHALHLCPKSLLPTVTYQLSQSTDRLIVITPNKNPSIDNFFTLKREIIVDRIRLREYN